MSRTSDPPTPTAQDGVDVRIPGWARIYLFAFGVAWVGFLAWSSVPRVIDGDAGALQVAPVAVIGVLVVHRGLRVRAHTQGDELVVRNPWRTRTIRRTDIDDVRTGNPQNGPLTFGEGVLVLLNDGSTVHLEATLRTGWTARGREEVAEQRRKLLAWARAGRPPNEGR